MPRSPYLNVEQMISVFDARFYLFVSPWIAGFLLLTVAPLAYTAAMSLTNFDGASDRYRFIGLRNYVELFTGHPDALHSLGITVAFTVLVVPLSVAAGLGLAVLVNRRMRAVGLVRAIFAAQRYFISSALGSGLKG